VFKLTKGDAPDTAQMNARVRTMIAEALRADGVEEIFKMGEDAANAVDIFDDDYLAKIEKIKLPNTRIKLLQQLLAKAIEDFKKVNKAKGVDFSAQFKALVDRYNERKEDDVLPGWRQPLTPPINAGIRVGHEERFGQPPLWVIRGSSSPNAKSRMKPNRKMAGPCHTHSPRSAVTNRGLTGL
jgi:hypothetical protein